MMHLSEQPPSSIRRPAMELLAMLRTLDDDGDWGGIPAAAARLRGALPEKVTPRDDTGDKSTIQQTMDWIVCSTPSSIRSARQPVSTEPERAPGTCRSAAGRQRLSACSSSALRMREYPDRPR